MESLKGILEPSKPYRKYDCLCKLKVIYVPHWLSHARPNISFVIIQHLSSKYLNVLRDTFFPESEVLSIEIIRKPQVVQTLSA